MKFWNFRTIKNESNNLESVELRIDGDIVSNDDAWLYEWFGIQVASPNAFRNELAQYAGKDITVWIDSCGGDVFAGAGIYNALKEHNGEVTVKIDSKAMSAASVIAMGGDKILMSPVAIMMIHNPLTSTYGNMHDLRKTADILDVVKETIVNAYVNKTGKTRDEIAAMMDDESWMSANVAVKNGFADDVLYNDQPVEISNIKDFAYNRLAITNNVNDNVKKLFAIEKEQVTANAQVLAKEKLLIELDLI